MTGYRVERCRDEDLVLDLQAGLLPADQPVAFDAPRTAWWVARDPDGQPVGFGGLSPSHQFRAAGYLCRAAVAPAHRRRGLHRRLLGARLADARRRGWEAVVTDTLVDNCASANSLISCGFTLYRPRRPWLGEDCLYWRRWL